MRMLDDRGKLPFHLRLKGADVDKPEGYIKRKLRRKWRAVLKRGLRGFTA